MANTHLLITPSTSLRRGSETMRNRAVRPNREIARAMDFFSIICFGLGARLPTTVMIWYLYQGFTAPAPGRTRRRNNLQPFRGFVESTGMRLAVAVRAPGGVPWKALFERVYDISQGNQFAAWG